MMKRKFKDQGGTSAVEFALVLPMLVTLVFGIIEFSLLLYDKAMITNASREGVRAGIVLQTPRVTNTEIQTVVDSYLGNHLVTFGSASSPTTTITRAGDNFGDPLTVTVTYSYNFLVLPNFITTINGPLNVTATAVMRME